MKRRLFLLLILTLCVVTCINVCGCSGGGLGEDDPPPYIKTEYTVTLNPNGGTLSGSNKITVTVGKPYTLEEPTLPSESSSTFDGWYYGNVKISSKGVWGYYEDVTLTAKWYNVANDDSKWSKRY